MIYLFCGAIITVIGIMFLIHPAKRSTPLYGYYSYLATTNDETYALAQKWSRNQMLIFGPIQIVLGILIHVLNWDNYFYVWLFTFYFFILPIFVNTETKLKKYLIKHDELPTDYVDPDESINRKKRH